MKLLFRIMVFSLSGMVTVDNTKSDARGLLLFDHEYKESHMPIDSQFLRTSLSHSKGKVKGEIARPQCQERAVTRNKPHTCHQQRSIPLLAGNHRGYMMRVEV